ncbi:alpha/beta hydrolase-fold protein [Actinoplanes sp. NPDC026619]|uniref:alpha/beta hydrolase n=1 Tax=Actinoplanes sp. NPDC026619 TaxID=3155798 RepID=UPI0033DAF321
MSVALALAAVLAIAVLLATFWNRLRLAGRSGLILAAVLSVVAAAALQVNQLVQAYPTGGTPAAAASGSQMLTVSVPGRASQLTLQMYVYLPAAYRTGRDRFPVIEALHGYPGSPQTWLRRLGVQSYLDREIAAGRMAPTVVLFPYQTPNRLLDTECTNLRGGPQTETFLTVDVPAYARAHYRVRHSDWGLTGYSAGAFCAINLALRHPGFYEAAASLSGYASPGIKIGDGSENTTNNPGWRLRHLPQPPIALWLGWAADDRESAHDSRRLATLRHPPLSLTTAVVAHGGHSDAVWTRMEPPAFDWLSAHLPRPLS